MGDLPITEAQILALFFQTLFYGIYIATSFPTWEILATTSIGRLKRLSDLNWFMVGASCIFFLVSTLEVSLSCYHVIRAFVLTAPGGAAADFLHLSEWINVFKSTNIAISASTSDVVLIYRCYIVYNRNWKIIVPSSLMLIAYMFIGFAIPIIQSRVVGAAAISEAQQVVKFIHASLAISVAQNVLTTVLLVWQIWSVDKRTSGSVYATQNGIPTQRSTLRNIIRIIIESGIMITFAMAASLITALVNSNADYITSDSGVIITGIAFNMIVLRTARNSASRSASESDSRMATIPLHHLSRHRETDTKHQTVHVMVEHETTRDIDSGGDNLNEVEKGYAR
ncbi:hypothetical protein C8J56DRAFT_1162532 [Mycena floridula]|nr:hypothetical protein C8J56DRAFT_1162532 [Mycena floridula]